MYKIEKKPFGYHITLGGKMDYDEMEQWLLDSKKELVSAPERFGVFVDLRMLEPIMPDVQEQLQLGQAYYKQMGMTRSVVILNNNLLLLQFQRIAKESGIYEWERYIDASSTPNWQKAGEDWVIHAIDPAVGESSRELTSSKVN